jgi:Flp pilus assembly protein TadD
MRSADRSVRSLPALLSVVASLGLGACTTVPLDLGPAPAPQGVAAVPAAAPAPTPSPAPAAPAAAATVAAEPTVAPSAQRAFDEARRAFRAARADDAERGFRAMTQTYPDLAGPHANLGVIWRDAGKLPEATQALEKAVALSPRQPVFWNQLGITLRHAGQFAKARQAYERAIELDPNYAAAVLNLAILHDLYLAEAPRALELYQRYAVLAPGESAAVNKWIADLRNRKPAAAGAPPVVTARQEAS